MRQHGNAKMVVIGVLSNGYPSVSTDPASSAYVFGRGLRDPSYVAKYVSIS
jgi:hypothetical protein